MSSAVVLGVALIHLVRPGARLTGAAYVLYYSYFSDVAVPFAVYFLLCIAEWRVTVLRSRRVKVLVVLGAASLAETAQGLGVPLLGRTFDPVDYVMFGVGAVAAVVTDAVLLTRMLGCGARSAATPTGVAVRAGED